MYCQFVEVWKIIVELAQRMRQAVTENLIRTAMESDNMYRPTYDRLCHYRHVYKLI